MHKDMTRRRRALAAQKWQSARMDDGKGLGSVLTEADMEAVVLATLAGHHPDPVPEEDLLFAIKEIEQYRVTGAMVDLVISGMVNLKVRDRELYFCKLDDAKAPA
jgi:hypothetical protein